MSKPIFPFDIWRELMIRSPTMLLNKSIQNLYNVSFWMDCFHYHQLPIPTNYCFKSYHKMKMSHDLAIKWRNYTKETETFSHFYPFHSNWNYIIDDFSCYDVTFKDDSLILSSGPIKIVRLLTYKQWIDYISLIIYHYNDQLTFMCEITNKSITVRQLINI